MGRTVDFSGVSDYSPAPAGTYDLEFTKFEFATTKNGPNKGGEYVKGQYTITDDVAEDGTAVQGKVIFTNYALTANALWRLKQDAIVLGVDEGQFQGQVDIEEVLSAMVGRHAVGHVTIEKYTYPPEHAKAGQVRESNGLDKLEQAEIPEALQPASRRRVPAA